MANNNRWDMMKWIEALIERYSMTRMGAYVRSKITWNKLFRVVSYTKSSLWIVPIIALLLEQIVLRVLHLLDTWLVYPFEGLGRAGAEAMLQTIITLTLSFTVFTFGSLLVAIQVASGQLTPRIIATALLRDNVVRYSVGLFVFTLVFTVSTLGRTDATVHQIPTFVAALLGLICMAAFLYLIDYAARLLRPVSIAGRLGKMGLTAIQSVYPLKTREQQDTAKKNIRTPARTVFHEGTGEIIVALNIEALVNEARTADGVIEFIPRIGDFIAEGEPLFHLYGSAALISDRKLRGTVAYGPERTVEQDPTFAFRILVDIALKALSPAINDPTTAVLCIDQLHSLLRAVGLRHLHTDEIPDGTGELRLIFRTPNWKDFVHLAFTEIRHCGAGQVQVARRLRAMIENLINTLPAHRHPALSFELDLLNRMIQQNFTLPEDLALAQVSDTQGL